MAEEPSIDYSIEMETTSFSNYIWKSKYRHGRDHSAQEQDIGDTWKRVSSAAAMIERDPAKWQRAFYEILSGYRSPLRMALRKELNVSRICWDITLNQMARP